MADDHADMGSMIRAGLKILLILIITPVIAMYAIGVGVLSRTGRHYHRVGRFWSRLLLKISGIRVIIRGAEHIQKGEHYIYVTNHASAFDIPIVVACIPDDVRIVYKKELERIPIFGWSLAVGHYIRIDRSKAVGAMRSLEKAAEKMRHGASVLLFAEGTRTLTGKLQDFKRGAFSLAVKAAVPIIPITINGSFKILPKKKFRINPGTVELILHQPIPITEQSGKQVELQMMGQVRAAIASMYIDQ
jgi:1-acyl-sn-glycerol-3-phosphate acyltransferase